MLDVVPATLRICTYLNTHRRRRRHHHHHHHHHISVMELGHLLTRSGVTYPVVRSKFYHDSFCQLGSSISLPWVISFSFPMPPHVRMNFRGFPPGCGDSVADF